MATSHPETRNDLVQQERRRPGPRLVLASRGDALTPHLFAALERRYAVAGRLDPELTRCQRGLVAATTFRPDRSRWAEAFFKSHLGYRLRSSNAGRQLARLPAPGDAVLQVHALFEVSDAPTALYVDCTHRQTAAHWPAWNPLRGPELARWYAREGREYRRAAHLFAFSQPTARSLVEDYDVPAEKVSVVGAGVNFAHLPDLADRPREPTILMVGNDFVRKGGMTLLEAFRRVRDAMPSARLQLVGTRPQIPEQPGVEVLGRVHDRAEVARLYERATVFAMPSFYDPFPLVLLEAMAHGLPTVTSASCGIPEMVMDGVTGSLVPAGDADALAVALLDLLGDPGQARRMGAAGRSRVEAHFLWDNVVDRMDPALQALAARQEEAR